ncbi:MAG: transcription elongation factor GreA [Acidobacteria bacterium]|nr:transcription elongation factor GreA [Acidobacteriota bacterium]
MEEVINKLKLEISTLEYELTNELPREILRARALGDLSENAEYHAAKERQAFVNARLGQLKVRLRMFSMVDLTRIPVDAVGLGSTVRVLDTGKDEELTYKLVTSEEADVTKGLISTTSPIGRSLLGRKVSDEVRVPAPSGMRMLEILSFTTIHDMEE